MRQKTVVFILALVLVVTGVSVSAKDVNAENSINGVDMSEVWTEDALVGYAEAQTWGIYLMEGISIINDAGTAKIGAGGITNATRACQVSVNVIVEQKVNGSWLRETSWTATKTSAMTVSSSKYVYVDTGYYYRVRSVHRASTDVSNSSTDALWM